MTPEKQRIAILTYMGWSNFSRLGRRGENGPETALRGTSPEGIKGQLCPNPLTNLNYIHEVEKTLDMEQSASYITRLCNKAGGWNEKAVCASSKVRIKSLLATLNLLK